MFDLISNMLIPSKSSENEGIVDDDEVRRLQQLAQNRRENGTVIMNGGSQTENKNRDCLTRKMFDGTGDSKITTRIKLIITKKSVQFIRNVCHRIRTVFELLKYPVIMLFLLILTLISVSMVLVNTLELLFGFRALPEYVQYVEVHSRHTFGIVGAVVEVVILV
ncbi:hypothetical protein FO519_004727 [Halicephalobus sp. NKZ332]|nr:hypothetical protein FO519_004727 [Halicephalobus sp. NKZ332]